MSLTDADFAVPGRVAPAICISQPGDGDDDPAKTLPFGPVPSEREELPYKVELWDEAKASVEQVLAITANGTIGYAAYYAATREFPDRYITLRHKNKIVSGWNGPKH
jgi:hypothetical protein